MKSFDVLGKNADEFCKMMLKYSKDLQVFYKKIEEGFNFDSSTYRVYIMSDDECYTFKKLNHDYEQYRR